MSAGTKTFTGAVTVNGTWNNSGGVAVGLGNNFANNGTFTSGAGTYTFSNANPTISGSSNTTFSGALSATGATGLIVNMGTAATTLVVSGAATFSSAFTVTQGAVTLNGASSVATILTVSAGDALTSANTLTVGTTTSISGSFNITGGATHTHTGTVTINSGGTWNNSGNTSQSFGASLTNGTGGTFTSGTGATTFTNATATVTGTAAITFSGATTFNNALAVAAGTVNFANAVTVTTTTAVTGTLGITSATGAKTFTGTVTINGSPATWDNSANANVSFGASLTNSAGGTFNSGTGTATFTNATATITGTAPITFSGATTFNNALAVAAGTVNFANAVTVTTTTAVTGTLGITSTTGAKTFTGTVTLANVATAIWNNTANADVSMGGSLTKNANATFNSGTGTLTFTAATATLTGAMTFNGNVTANNVTLAAATTITNKAATTITGNLAGTNAASSIWTNDPATNNVSLGVTGTLLTTGVLNATCTSPNLGTVNYSGAAQTVKVPSGAPATYCNLALSGSGVKTMPATAMTTNDFTLSGTASATGAAALTIAGDLNIGTGTTFATGAFTHNVAGDFTRTGTFTATAGGTMNFNGAAAQTLTGTATFQGLTFNNTGGAGVTVRVKNNLIVNATLTLTSGKIDLDTDGVSLEVTSSCATVARTGGEIVGSLTLHYPTLNPGTTTCTFHIGAVGTTAAGDYLPVIVAMTNVSSTLANSTLTVRTDAGDHSGVTSGAASIDPSQSVNRYWTMTGGGSLAFLKHSTTFTFLATDVDSGATTANFEVSRLTGGTWFGTAPGTRTATTTQALNETAFGIFAIGELIDTVFAEYRMEEGAQIGGTIGDTSGNGRNGVRLGNADTVLPSPSNPVSTICRGLNIPSNTAFGTIDALDTGVNLNQVGERGTITFWYKSTVAWVTALADRQLLDASSSTAQFFSLLLPANGRLTFAMRDTTGAAGYNLVQNASSAVAANTWAHIGVTWDLSSGTLQIYVNGAVVASTLTTVGTPNGALATLSSLYVGDNRLNALIGGTLNTPNSANGVIDELRIYRGVRSAAQIGADRTASYPVACDITAIPGRFNAFETSVSSASTTGSINTKTSGTSSTVKLVALNALHTAVDTTFTGATTVAKIEVLDASSDIAALDANKCRSSWTPISSPAPTAPTATFTLGVSTPYSFTVPDAYRNVRLRISYPAAAPVVIGCTTDNFAVRPASLSGIVAQDQTWTSAGTSRNLDNSGTVHKAGQPFSISATALNSASTATANYDGSPTIVTNSTTLINPAPASPECVSPACAVGSLTPGSWSVVDKTNNPGVIRTSSASYNEVGVFTVQLEDKTFASVDLTDTNPASGNSFVPASGAVTIGRFVPNHFVVTSASTPKFQTFGVADASCGGSAPKRSFTYIGQSFNWQAAPSITVTAKEAGGTTTKLYRGTLFKVTGADIAYTHSGNSGGATFNATPATASVTQNHDGTGTATAGADTFSYTRPTSTLAAFTAAISMTMDAKDQAEADGAITTDATGGATPLPVSFSTIAFDGGDFSLTLTGGKTFVYGRARLYNAYGSSQNDLPVDLRVEYYSGSTFATNAKDNCTSFSSDKFQLTYPGGSTLSSTNLGTSHISISGTFVAGLANLRLTKPSPVPASPGAASICLNLDTTTSGGDSSCQATAGNQTHLQGAWSGVSTNDKDPKATLGFGIYGAPKNLIYLRENY
jgi:hypothetical protein